MRIVEHLRGRGMKPELYRYSKSYSSSAVTFYLYNLSGQIVGYQRYKPLVKDKKVKNDPKSGRYYTYIPKNVIGVFGLELLNPDDRRLFVVEGVFKAAVLHRLGFNAIATLTATPKPMKPWFKILKTTWDLIAIGDPDAAGQKLVNTVKRGFCSPKDLDEMSDPDIIEMIDKYSMEY